MQRTFSPIVLVVFIGCGSSGETATNGAVDNGSADAATVACQGAFKRELGCNDQMTTIEADYLSWCKGMYACTASAFVPEYPTAYWPCANSRACLASDDPCSDSVAIARDENVAAVHEALDACEVRRDECKIIEGESFGDTCGLFPLAIPELMSELQACIAKPCGEIAACVDQAMAGHGCTHAEQPMLPPGFPGQE